MFSLGTLLGPWQGLSLSLGSQNEWTHQTGFGNANVDVALPFPPFIFPLAPRALSVEHRAFDIHPGGGRAFHEDSLYHPVRGRPASSRRPLAKRSRKPASLTPPFLLQTDTQSRLEDFRAGFNTSPWRRVSLSAQYRQYDHHTDYNNSRKESLGQPYEGYPGFILWRDLLSQEAEVKLSLKLASWLKTTLSYQWLDNKYHTATQPVDDPASGLAGGISPGGSLLAGTYDARTPTLNVILTPWRRLFLSTTFSYQNASTVTAANGSPSVAPYEGDIYSVMASASYVLDQKTDLTASYSFSMRRFCPEQLRRWFAAGNQVSTAGRPGRHQAPDRQRQEPSASNIGSTIMMSRVAAGSTTLTPRPSLRCCRSSSRKAHSPGSRLHAERFRRVGGKRGYRGLV